jgi:hypothetical protein
MKAQDTWLRQAASLFEAHADLSLLGGYTGKNPETLKTLKP